MSWKYFLFNSLDSNLHEYASDEHLRKLIILIKQIPIF